MKTLKLKTHTQFGDLCICYGFIKEFAKHYDRVYVFTKMDKMHQKNVRRVYLSIPNVVISPLMVAFDKEIVCDAKWYSKTKPYYADPTLEVEDEDLIFDRHWYKLAGVPFEKKWDFYFKRDEAKEKELFYDVLGLRDNESFVFLQDDDTRNFVIDKSYIDKRVRLIESSKLLGHSILDMMMLVERAKEVHVINSSFLSLIDLMGIQHGNLNYHKYTRPCAVEQPMLRLRWKVINK